MLCFFEKNDFEDLMIQRSYLFFLLLLGVASCKVVEYQQVYLPISVEEFNKKPKRVIFMIGDGMGLPHITASMYAKDNRTVLEQFPVVGLQKCDSRDALATDSAAGATAMACGVKTFNQALGVDKDTVPRTSILMEAGQKGFATGIVTTSSIVHATPAGFYAHCSQRYQYEKIALDFLSSGIDFAIGGGKKYFDRRQDDRNLYQELEAKGYRISTFLTQTFRSANPPKDHPYIFFTADSEPLPASQGRTYLPQAAQLAIKHLSVKSNQGYFLLIEGAQIDWSGHARNGTELLSEMKDFEKAVSAVIEYIKDDPETLLIVTADHETGGLTLAPTSKLNDVSIEFASNAHTPQMVPVFAMGPGASYFSGVYDNTDIYKKLRLLLNFE